MADARCPMCGKPNPVELDVCQHCQARLKPLQVSPPATEPELPAEQALGQAEMGFMEGELERLDAPDLPAGKEEEEAAGWLTDIRSDFGTFEGESAEELEPAETPVEGDWLARLDSQETPQQPDTSDWLKEMREAAPAEESPPISEWLAQEEKTAEQAGLEAGLPAWLSQPRLDEAPATSEEDLKLPEWFADKEAKAPNWLEDVRSMAGASEELPSETEPEDIEVPEWLSENSKNLPDWLSGTQAKAPEPTAPAEAQGQEDREDLSWLSEGGLDVPEWLSGKAPESGSVIEPSAEQVEATPKDELPDWLAGLEGSSAEEEAELPDWMTGMESMAGEKAPEEALPEWMAVESKPVEAPLPAAPPAQPVEEAAQGESQAEEEPDWLSELEAAFPNMPVAGPSVPVVLPTAEAFTPFNEEEAFEADLGEPLPSWLSETQLRGVEEAAEVPGEEAGVGLMPADLPDWLEAMRPVETVAASPAAAQEMGDAEAAGPLTGLRGVLPAEPDIFYIRKPTAYSAKLQVSEIQQANADLLRKLIDAEGEPQPVPGRAVVTSQHILRIVIAVALILAVLFPILLDMPQVQVPLVPVDETFQLISGLATGSPVLLAIDYEPGLSGEMDAVTGAVVYHLMIQGAYLTLVSTTPTGPLQAERLMAVVNQIGGHHYSTPGQYANLGYISGGPMGLRGFAEDPRKILPGSLTGDPVWQNSGLQTVSAISDFGLVIVATENPDTARAWIEQVQPKMGNSSLILVVSAQAEPMVRPYYEAYPKQVSGLVSGLAGGVIYESATGHPGNASTYWAPFSIGMLVAMLLMVIGGAINAASAFWAKSEEGPKGEA